MQRPCPQLTALGGHRAFSHLQGTCPQDLSTASCHKEIYQNLSTKAMFPFTHGQIKTRIISGMSPFVGDGFLCHFLLLQTPVLQLNDSKPSAPALQRHQDRPAWDCPSLSHPPCSGNTHLAATEETNLIFPNHFFSPERAGDISEAPRIIMQESCLSNHHPTAELPGILEKQLPAPCQGCGDTFRTCLQQSFNSK